MLSKAIGGKLIVWAHGLGLVTDADLSLAMSLMSTSNRSASQHAVRTATHACTDITGFGLIGHLSEMLGSEQGADLCLDAIPRHPAIASLPHAVLATAATGA